MNPVCIATPVPLVPKGSHYHGFTGNETAGKKVTMKMLDALRLRSLQPPRSDFQTKLHRGAKRMLNLYNGDCLDVMKLIPSGSVDLVLCDLPYGTTACKWDSIVPLSPLFTEYWRVSKQSAPVVLTAVQPFSSQLVSNQPGTFRYEWVWVKNLPTGFATANRQPMRAHESVLVFYRAQPTYNKQDTCTKIADRKLGGSNGLRAAAKQGGAYGQLATKIEEIVLKSSVSPRTTLEVPCVPRATGTLHPTQKPVALMEYLIKTYTNPGDMVLDNCMGSGTTGVACVNTGRNFIGIEKDPAYFEICKQRIEGAEVVE